MLSRSGLCLLVVACAGAYQAYDDDQSDYIDGDTTYNDDNYSDISRDSVASGVHEDPFHELALLRLIAARKRSSDVLELRKSRLHAARDTKNRSHLSEAKVKDIKMNPVTPKPSRWRIRRRPGLCLLKLCAPYYMQW